MKQLLYISVFILSFLNSTGQLLINEISASCNTNIIADDNGKSQDWIEIYNPTTGAVNASAFYLSDKLTVPKLWQMPNVSIPAGGFLKVYCSQENRVNGIFYHTNFKIDRQGEKVYLANSAGTVLDTKQLGNLDLNHSYGRSPDGSANWVYFNAPSPGTSNNSAAAYTGYAGTVSIAPTGGFYGGPQTVTLTCPGFQIRYTTDGSEPTLASTLYGSAILTNTSTSIRAKAFPSSGNILPGFTATSDYLINETGIGNLAVVCIVMDPADFNLVYNFPFNGPNTNFPERMAHLSYYDKYHVKKFETYFDMRKGGTSSSYASPQKTLKVNTKGYYNDSKIKYPLFTQKNALNEFDGIVLRNDCSTNNFNDEFIPSLVRGTNNPFQFTSIDNQAHEPSIVYINGKYYGVYEICEKSDNDWATSNFKVDADSVDLVGVKFDSLTTCANTKTQALNGSDTGLIALETYMLNNTPNTSTFYNYVSSKLDVNNFTDYFIAQTYWENMDWINNNYLNNIKVWRKRGGGPNSKWRYFMYDLDYCLYYGQWAGSTLPTVLSTCTNIHSNLLGRFLMNTQYKNYFINRHADLMNTIFLPSNVTAVANALRDTMDPAMLRHFTKWQTSSIYSFWYNNVSGLGSWTNVHTPAVRNSLQSYFTLVKQVTTTFEVYPAGAGYVMLNTIEPHTYPWSGVYFDGCPITITAKPANSAYVFDHWESPDLGTFNTNSSNTFNVNSTQTIKLFFKLKFLPLGVNESTVQNECSLFPNPSNGVLKLKMSDETVTVISATLYNLSGARSSDTKNFTSSDSVFDVSSLTENTADGVYFLEIRSKDKRYFEKVFISSDQK